MLRGLFAYLLFPSHLDTETALPVLCGRTLAMLEGCLPRWEQRHFSGQRSIDAYRTAVGHEFEISRPQFHRHLARTVTNLNLDPVLDKALHDELRTRSQPGQEVTLVSGSKCSRQRRSNARKADQARGAACDTPYKTAREAVLYLNALPPKLFSGAVCKHYEQAVEIALRGDNPVGRYQDLVTLRSMLVQPQQFYAPSSRARTCRIFPAHRGLCTLSKEVAMVIGQDWIMYDLRSSQLAIAAFLWNVTELIDFFRSGQVIWQELYSALGLDSSWKPKLKEAVYALTYGGSRNRIIRCMLSDQAAAASDREIEDELTVVEESLGRGLLKHPLMASLYEARQEQLAKIRQAQGARDCYGNWIQIPMDSNPYASGELTPNPRSVLAQVAQAVELKILEPVFARARSGTDFSVTHWAHDGFSIHVHDRRRVNQVCARIEEAVRNSAANEGVETYLERTYDPFAA